MLARVLAVVVSVCLSVSHTPVGPIVSKQLHILSYFLHAGFSRPMCFKIRVLPKLCTKILSMARRPSTSVTQQQQPPVCC